MTAPGALVIAWSNPELFEVRRVDGELKILVRPEAEGKPCPCCGLLLKGSPLPRTRPGELVSERQAHAIVLDFEHIYPKPES